LCKHLEVIRLSNPNYFSLLNKSDKRLQNIPPKIAKIILIIQRQSVSFPNKSIKISKHFLKLCMIKKKNFPMFCLGNPHIFIT
jgi:hypothetical protein